MKMNRFATLLPHRPQPGPHRRQLSIMILRDAFAGFTRFDEFQKAATSRPIFCRAA